MASSDASHHAPDSPPFSPTPESSRASQLSAFSEYSYEELTRRIFYKPEGEDESGRVRPVVPELARRPSGSLNISQVLPPAEVVPQPVPKARDKGPDVRLSEQANRPASRNSATTTTTPGQSTSHDTRTDEPPHSTPMTSPATSRPGHGVNSAELSPRRSDEGSQPGPSLFRVLGNLGLGDIPEPGSSVHSIPDASAYPRVKIFPPPKGKRTAGDQSDSPGSSRSLPSQIPTIPSSSSSPQADRRMSAPVPAVTPLSPSRHVRFRSEVDIALGIDTDVAPSPDSFRDQDVTPTSVGRFILSPVPRSPVIERTMFIVGFLFPWCWLIGGWLVPMASKSAPACVPSLDRFRRGTAHHLLPTHRSPVSPSFHSQPASAVRSYALTLARNTNNTPSRSERNAKRARWARRCRIAAAGAAVVITAGIAVAIYGAVVAR